MEQQLKDIFGEGRASSCLSLPETRIEFLVADDENTGKSFIVPPEDNVILEDECFKVLNTKSKEIKILSIDACFLTPENGYDGRKCDFIIFSNEKCCFVELKTNATSTAGKKIRENIKSAIEQLGFTINYFDDNNVDFSDHNLAAYIVLKPKLYRTSLEALTSKQERKKKFFDEFEIDLYEAKETSF